MGGSGSSSHPASAGSPKARGRCLHCMPACSRVLSGVPCPGQHGCARLLSMARYWGGTGPFRDRCNQRGCATARGGIRASCARLLSIENAARARANLALLYRVQAGTVPAHAITPRRRNASRAVHDGRQHGGTVSPRRDRDRFLMPARQHGLSGHGNTGGSGCAAVRRSVLTNLKHSEVAPSYPHGGCC